MWVCFFLSMGIKDYKKAFNYVNTKFFNNSKISDTNKQYIEDYLNYYSARKITYARQCIFLENVTRFLELCPGDVKDTFEDRNTINKIFAKLRDAKFTVTRKVDGETKQITKGYGEATIGTVINCAKSFTTWLNDGTKPKSFRDIKSKNVKRDLHPTDMLSEKEINKLLSDCKDIQIKALLALQLEAGLRPGELYALKIGDLKKSGSFINIQVRSGKTGKRTTLLHKSIPQVVAWLNQHPLKDSANAHLWITEYEGRCDRPSLNALRKRIRVAFKNSELSDKPCDFYALRHVSNVRRKRDGVQDSMAAKMAGHSVKVFSETYGRLCDSDLEQAMSKAYGITKTKDTGSPVKCACGHDNVFGSDYCTNCGKIINANKLMKDSMDQETKIKETINDAVEQKVLEILSNKLKNIPVNNSK